MCRCALRIDLPGSPLRPPVRQRTADASIDPSAGHRFKFCGTPRGDPGVSVVALLPRTLATRRALGR